MPMTMVKSTGYDTVSSFKRQLKSHFFQSAFAA